MDQTARQGQLMITDASQKSGPVAPAFTASADALTQQLPAAVAHVKLPPGARFLPSREINTVALELANGMRIALRYGPEWANFNIDIWVNAGTDSTAGFHPGIAHMREHLGFRTHMGGGYSPLLGRIRDELGGEVNGDCSTRVCVYGGHIAPAHKELLLEALSAAVVTPPLQDRAYLEKLIAIESRRIGTEDALADDNRQQRHFLQLLGMAYPGMPTGHEVNGDPVDLHTITPEAMIAFDARAYAARHTVIAIEAHMPQQQMLDLVLKYFPMRSGAEVQTSIKGGYESTYAHIDEPAKGTTTTIGFKNPNPRSDDNEFYKLQVLNRLLFMSKDSAPFAQQMHDGYIYKTDAMVWRGGGNNGLDMVRCITLPENAHVGMQAMADSALAFLQNPEHFRPLFDTYRTNEFNAQNRDTAGSETKLYQSGIMARQLFDGRTIEAYGFQREENKRVTFDDIVAIAHQAFSEPPVVLTAGKRPTEPLSHAHIMRMFEPVVNAARGHSRPGLEPAQPQRVLAA